MWPKNTAYQLSNLVVDLVLPPCELHHHLLRLIQLFVVHGVTAHILCDQVHAITGSDGQSVLHSHMQLLLHAAARLRDEHRGCLPSEAH